MARDPDAPSRIELLILSSLARVPMHGYELKSALARQHVRWWAKCEHGHLYTALPRLQRRGYLRAVSRSGQRGKTVYQVTTAGLARAKAALLEFGEGADPTYFDVDLFIWAALMLSTSERTRTFWARSQTLRRQLAQAQAIRKAFPARAPMTSVLLIEHRIAHLKSELAFTSKATRALATSASRKPRPRRAG